MQVVGMGVCSRCTLHCPSTLEMLLHWGAMKLVSREVLCRERSLARLGRHAVNFLFVVFCELGAWILQRRENLQHQFVVVSVSI